MQVAGRVRQALDEEIGIGDLFAVPTLIDFARVVESARQSKLPAIVAQQHQDIPFEQVLELVQPVRSLAHSPLFQVTFTWLEGLEDRPRLPGLIAGPLQLSPHRVAKFDLALLIAKCAAIRAAGEYGCRAGPTAFRSHSRSRS